MGWIIGIIVVAVIIGVMWVSLYNSLVKNKLWVTEAWSQIDVQLKRRNDLIPNMIETVKGYAKYEQETLTKVISLRNMIADMGSEDPGKKMELSNQLSSQLKTVFALAEATRSESQPEFLGAAGRVVGNRKQDRLCQTIVQFKRNPIQHQIGHIPEQYCGQCPRFPPEVVLATPEGEKSVPKVSF